MKKIVSVLLCIAVLLVMTVPVSAAMQYTYIDTIAHSFDFNDFWGVANCSGTVQCLDGNDLKVEVTLQMRGDSGWEDLKTWTDTGNYTVSASGSWAVARGEEYRLYVAAYVYDEDGWIVESDVQTQTKYF